MKQIVFGCGHAEEHRPEITKAQIVKNNSGDRCTQCWIDSIKKAQGRFVEGREDLRPLYNADGTPKG